MIRESRLLLHHSAFPFRWKQARILNAKIPQIIQSVFAKEENPIFDFVSIGEILVDLTKAYDAAADRPVFLQNAGGAPANVACALAKFGVSAAFCGKAGDDPFGRFCKDILEENGVSTEYFYLSSQYPTTLSVVDLSPSGDRSFSFYRTGTADVNLSPEDVWKIKYEEIKNFHFGTVSLTAEPSRSAVLQAVELAHKSGAVISCDVNLRPSLWLSREEMKREVLDMLKTVPIDILKLSAEELSFLTGRKGIDDGIAAFSKAYPCQLLFVTCGAEGAAAYYQEKQFFSPPYRVKALDTTGAGDFFLAAALYYMISNSLLVTAISEDDLETILRFANAAAALSTVKYGAIPSIPSLDAIMEMQISHS